LALSIDTLLRRGRVPSPDDIDADHFHRYFDEVAGVRSATADDPPPSFPPTSQASFCQFQSVTADDVTAAVRALPDKSCALDPLPTAQLKAVVDLIAPFLAHMFNKSLMSGSVPEVFKSAFITPRLKKSNMDPADVKSYRPISNLSVACKLLERLHGGSSVTPTPQASILFSQNDSRFRRRSARCSRRLAYQAAVHSAVPAYCEDVTTVPDAGQRALSLDTLGQTKGRMGADG